MMASQTAVGGSRGAAEALRRKFNVISHHLDALSDAMWCAAFFILPSEDEEGVEGYYDIIRDPVSVETITRHFVDGDYEDVPFPDKRSKPPTRSMRRDFELMVENCATFNGCDHPLTGVARKMFDDFGVDKIFPWLLPREKVLYALASPDELAQRCVDVIGASPRRLAFLSDCCAVMGFKWWEATHAGDGFPAGSVRLDFDSASEGHRLVLGLVFAAATLIV